MINTAEISVKDHEPGDILSVIVLGSISSGKTYTLRSMVSMQGIDRDLIFPAVNQEEMDGARPATSTGMNYDFDIVDRRNKPTNTVAVRYRGRSFDPPGGIVSAPSREDETARIIREEYRGASLIIVCLEPKSIFGPSTVDVLDEDARQLADHEVGLERKLKSINAWINECSSTHRPPFIAVCFTKADEYGIHFDECGRIFRTKWHADHFQIEAEANRQDEKRSEHLKIIQNVAQENYGDTHLCDLTTEIFSRVRTLTLGVSNYAVLGQSWNFYFTAACPHVPRAAQLEGGALAGPRAPNTTSAGATDFILDWQRWVFDQRSTFV